MDFPECYTYFFILTYWRKEVFIAHLNCCLLFALLYFQHNMKFEDIEEAATLLKLKRENKLNFVTETSEPVPEQIVPEPVAPEPENLAPLFSESAATEQITPQPTYPEISFEELEDLKSRLTKVLLEFIFNISFIQSHLKIMSSS